jgi:very-short-patch-repair endonuclease
MENAPDADDWYFDHVIDQRVDGAGRVVSGPLATWDLWWRDQARTLEREWPGLVATATRQGFALTTRQLAELGVPRHVARRLVARGIWSCPQRGCVGVVTIADEGNPWVVARRRHALDCAAAALLNPDHMVGEQSAAVLHGLPTMRVPDHVVLTAPAPRVSRRARSRIAGLAPLECTTWWGVPVTTVARTVVDLARLDRRNGLMAADAALHEEVVRKDQIDAALGRAAGWPGIRQARALLELASPKPESALESLVRLALHDSGFPAPELQVTIRTSGRTSYRVDIVWMAQKLIIEADGSVKYRAATRDQDDPGWAEKKRETALRRVGFEVERVLWDDVVRSWPATEARLRPYFR